MPLAVKFRDIEKDILNAVCCGRYEGASNSGSDSEDESDRDEDSFEGAGSVSMSRQQVSNHSRGVPLHPLAPDSGVNLLHYWTCCSDTHMLGPSNKFKGQCHVSCRSRFVHDSGDDLENA